MKNPNNHTGSSMICRIFNSWFHLQSACPYLSSIYRNIANILTMGDEIKTTILPTQNNFVPQENI